MEITIVTSSVTRIGLRTSSFVLLTNTKKEKTTLTEVEKQNDRIRTQMLTVLSSRASPMYAFPPSIVQRNLKKNAFAKTQAFHRASLKPRKYQHSDLPKSLRFSIVIFRSTKNKSHNKINKNIKNTPIQEHL